MTVGKKLPTPRSRRDIMKGTSILGGGILAMPNLGRLAFAPSAERAAPVRSAHIGNEGMATLKAEGIPAGVPG